MTQVKQTAQKQPGDLPQAMAPASGVALTQRISQATTSPAPTAADIAEIDMRVGELW